MTNLHTLYNLVLKSYLQITNEIETEETTLRNEVKAIQNDKKKVQELLTRIRNLTTWRSQYQAQLKFLKSKATMIDNLVMNANFISKIFNYETKLHSNELSTFDELSLILNMISGVTPVIIGQYLDRDEKYNFINGLNVSFWSSTQQFDHKVYGWNPITQTGTSDGNRYLSNCKVFDLKLKSENSKDEVEKSMAKSVLKLLEKTTAQARYGTIWLQILSMLFYKQTESSLEYYSNLPSCITRTEEHLHACKTYSFQTIIRLLTRYTFVPFRIKKGSVLINKQNNQDWSTQLPILLSILVNGVIWEMTGVLDEDAAKVYITHMLTAAKTSTIDYLLSWKSKFRKWIKLAIFKSKKIAMLSWYMEQPNGIRYANGEDEIFLEDEHDQLIELVDTYPAYYSGYVKRCLKNIEDLNSNDSLTCIHKTLLIRHYMITSHSISCGSNYNKTSPALCLMDASGTKINTNFKTPRVTKQFTYNGMRLNLNYSWSELDEMFDNVASELKEMVDQAYDSTTFKNIEHEYVSFLTNKSGGAKYNENYSEKILTTIPHEVQKVSQTRIINFLLTSKMFYTLNGIDKLCTGKTTAGYREQIDRRMRVIAVVRNIMQLLTLPLILIFNQMKGKIDEIAMGKQVGNILDAIFQIEASSTAHGFMTSSDVSGMDASVLKQVAQFVRHTIVDRLTEHVTDSKRIFAFTKADNANVTNINPDGEKSETIEDVPALKIMTVYLEAQDGKGEMEANDGFFTATVSPSDQTFKSGELFTSGNHTVLLICIVRSLLNKPRWRKFKSKFRVLGDDFFFRILNGEDAAEVIAFLLELRDAMKPFNLVLELDGSRYYGDFLQQSALCGLFVPKPSRSSIQNVEKSDIADRNPMDIIRMVIDTSAVTSNRVYSQENIVPLIRSIWFIIRAKKYVSYNQELKIKTPPHYRGMLNISFSHNTHYIILPFMLISVSPIGFPPILLDDVPNVMTRLTFLTPGGDFMYNYWFQVFMNKEVSIPVTKQINKQWLVSNFMNYCINWKERSKFGITFSEHLLTFKRKSELSDHKIESIGAGVIKILQDTFIAHADQDKLKRSQRATEQLFDSGFVVPSGLTYEGRERKKIILSFESKLETQDEQEYLDKRYIDHINDYVTVPTSLANTYLYNSFTTTLSDEKREHIHLTTAALTCGVFHYLPIIPACHQSSNLLYISRLVGFVNKNDYKITASITRLGESVGFGFDAERAIAVGVKVANQDIKLLDTYIEAIGLGLKDGILFRQIVQNIINEGYRSTYQSIFPLNKYFISPGDASLFQNILTKQSYSSLSIALPPTNILLLCRDILFAYGPTLKQNNIDLQCNYLNWLSLESIRREGPEE